MTQPPSRPLLAINGHGLFGVLLVVGAITIVVLRDWKIPWFYFVAAVIGYAVVVFISSERLDATRNVTGPRLVNETEQNYLRRVRSASSERWMATVGIWGGHLAFLFLGIGLLIPFHGFWVGLGIFIGCVVSGFLIPVLILRPARA